MSRDPGPYGARLEGETSRARLLKEFARPRGRSDIWRHKGALREALPPKYCERVVAICQARGQAGGRDVKAANGVERATMH